MTEAIRQFLEKRATVLAPVWGTAAKASLGSIGLKTLLGAGLGALSLGGAYGLIGAGRAIHEKATRNRDYNAMLRENPDLKKEPEKDVHRFFQVLRDFAPEITENPDVAGAYVRQAVYSKEVGTAPAAIKQLVDIATALREKPRKSGRLPEALQGAIFQGGLQAGMHELGQM